MLPNRQLVFKTIKKKHMTPLKHRGLAGPTLLVLLTLLAISVKAQVADTTGHVYTIYSSILREKRKIHIRTPQAMNPFDAYPVLYVLDGEAHTTMVAGQVNYLSEAYKIIPNLIVVGIENTDRVRDLTPTHSIMGPDSKPDTSIHAFGKNSGGGEK